MSYAAQLRAVRAHFALTQAELASWLGLSREMLAQVETQREQLPAHARPWLHPWLMAFAAAAPAAGAAPAPEAAVARSAPPGAPAPVRARWAECHY